MVRRLSSLCLLVMVLAACGAPATGSSPTAAPAPTVSATPLPTAAPPTAAPTEAPPAETAFPAVIEHKFGSTTIEQTPERIVTVGLTEQDVLLALGITPVGTTEWFGKHPGALWPWAREKLSGELPTVIGDATAVNFEQIAALKPDLILALYSGLTQEQYDLLAQIAPTVAQPAAYVDYGVPWQELTRTVGKAVGKAAEAEQLVADVEARFARVRSEHPEFSGATAVVATPYEGIWVYGPEDVRGRFLSALGFALPEGLAEITGAEFGGNLSMERADLLDVDVIVWLDANEATGPLGGPLYANLAVHTEGREVFLSSYDDPLGGATSFVSVLSLPFLLDGLVPRLAAAVDGDPATLVGGATPPATDGTRSVTDATGALVQAPVDPQRVVVLSEQDLDGALALGIKPLGSVNGRGQPGLPAYLGTQIDGIESLGALSEPNLEKIAALQPDLILIGGIFGPLEAMLPALRDIAPTVVTYNLDDDWKTAFMGTAAALNKTAEAEAWLAAYDQQVAELKNSLGTQAGASVSITRWMPEGPVVMAFDSFSSRVVRDLGLIRPETQQSIEGYSHSEPISLEQLDQIDGDWLFIGTLNADGATSLANAGSNPLFMQLNTVKNKRVVEVDGRIWTSRGGPQAALIVLDDIKKSMEAQ